MPAPISDSHLMQLTQIAKTNAIAGASAGVAIGVIHSIVSVRQSPPRDRYGVVAQGLTSVGTGAVLGALAATVTALAGVSVAAIAGRGALAIAVPMVATTVATNSAHKPVERLVRSWSEDVAKGLKRTLEREASPDVT
jgi:cobalamin biosynthesis protein CobD/CbiB